jgi:hypothetical protein
MDDYHIKMQAIEELKDAVRIRKASVELMEHFTNSVSWLLYYAEKNGIELPEKDKMLAAVNRAIEIQCRLPTASEQPNRNNRKGNTTKVLVATSFLVIF